MPEGAPPTCVVAVSAGVKQLGGGRVGGGGGWTWEDFDFFVDAESGVRLNAAPACPTGATPLVAPTDDTAFPVVVDLAPGAPLLIDLGCGGVSDAGSKVEMKKGSLRWIWNDKTDSR